MYWKVELVLEFGSRFVRIILYRVCKAFKLLLGNHMSYTLWLLNNNFTTILNNYVTPFIYERLGRGAHYSTYFLYKSSLFYFFEM